jgi:hypothetical protein
MENASDDLGLYKLSSQIFLGIFLPETVENGSFFSDNGNLQQADGMVSGFVKNRGFQG